MFFARTSYNSLTPVIVNKNVVAYGIHLPTVAHAHTPYAHTRTQTPHTHTRKLTFNTFLSDICFRVIKLFSPKINTVIAIGCGMSLLFIPLLGLDNPEVVGESWLCSVGVD